MVTLMVVMVLMILMMMIALVMGREHDNDDK
jgi:Tfp pilus assembly protein PilX